MSTGLFSTNCWRPEFPRSGDLEQVLLPGVRAESGSANPDSQPRPASPVLGFLGTALHLSATWLASPKILAMAVLGGLATYFVGLMISIAISRAYRRDRSPQDRAEPPAHAPARIIAACDVDGKARPWRIWGRSCRRARHAWPRESSNSNSTAAPAFASRPRRVCAAIGPALGADSRAAGGLRAQAGAGLHGQYAHGGSHRLGHGIRRRSRWPGEHRPARDPGAGRSKSGSQGRSGRAAAAKESPPARRFVSPPTARRRPGFPWTRLDSTPSARRRPPRRGPLSNLRAGRPIALGNLFDDPHGTPLAEAMQTDTFRAEADVADLGVIRVVYGGKSLQEIAPGIWFDLANLGWQEAAIHHHIANDAWSEGLQPTNAGGPAGGIRAMGVKMGFSEPKIEEGIGMHADAFITFDLDEIRAAGGLQGREMLFISDPAGINDGALGDGGSIHLAALVSTRTDVRTAMVDGARAKLSKQDEHWSVTSAIGEPLRADGKFVEFRMPIRADDKYLTLISGDAGDGWSIDHGVWIGARLEVAR